MSEILSKYVAPGGEVELKAIDRERNPEENGQRKAHRSRLLKILTESRVEVAMPIVDGKLILLPVDGEYDMYFYGDNVVYQCNARVTDRYRFNGQYVLVMDLTSNLRNYQRREYYRFSCAGDGFQTARRGGDRDCGTGGTVAGPSLKEQCDCGYQRRRTSVCGILRLRGEQPDSV